VGAKNAQNTVIGEAERKMFLAYMEVGTELHITGM
jgi:hypothetical protein